MVELSMTPVFEASDPVEAMEFDNHKSRMAVSSHHGRVSVYQVGRSGKQKFNGIYPSNHELGMLLMLWNSTVDSTKAAYIA